MIKEYLFITCECYDIIPNEYGKIVQIMCLKLAMVKVTELQGVIMKGDLNVTHFPTGHLTTEKLMLRQVK